MTQLEALRLIDERDNGLKPKAVVDAARPENSPLHGAFCWDDTEAAERYRIIQAQDLIRSYKEIQVIEEKKYKGPMYVNVPITRVGSSAENRYMHIDKVRKNQKFLDSVLAEALEQLKGFRDRYRYLSQLKKLWDVLDELIPENEQPEQTS